MQPTGTCKSASTNLGHRRQVLCIWTVNSHTPMLDEVSADGSAGRSMYVILLTG